MQKSSVSIEVCAGAIISVVQYLALLRYAWCALLWRSTFFWIDWHTVQQILALDLSFNSSLNCFKKLQGWDNQHLTRASHAKISWAMVRQRAGLQYHSEQARGWVPQV
jgi:hypothetical protein